MIPEGSRHLELVHSADEPRLETGGVVLAAPKVIPAVWGDSVRGVLWSRGETFVLCGQPGVGKSTVAQQVVIRLLGVRDDPLFGLQVNPARRVLYVAADRYGQILRSVRRMVSDDDYAALEERLALMRSLPYPATDRGAPDRTAVFCEREGVDTVVVDSLYNVLPSLKEQDVLPFVELTKALLTSGVEVMVVHHTRKATSENKRPTTLADVEGSGAIGKSAGSVLLLHGEPGDEQIEGLHVKQPGEPVGPLEITHDHEAGASEAFVRPSVRDALRDLGAARADAVAMACYGEVSVSSVKRARAKLEALVRRGRADCEDGSEDPLFLHREAA